MRQSSQVPAINAKDLTLMETRLTFACIIAKIYIVLDVPLFYYMFTISPIVK